MTQESRRRQVREGSSRSALPKLALVPLLAGLHGAGCAVPAYSVSDDPSVNGDGGTSPRDGSLPSSCKSNAECGTGASCFAGTCCTTPPLGGTCSLPACGCAAGQVCYPSDQGSTPHMTCMASDNIAEGERCDNQTCASGAGCFGGICSRYCTSEGDCPIVAGVRQCLETYFDETTTIEGVNVCSRICDPVHPQNPEAPFLKCPRGLPAASTRPPTT